MAFFLSLEGIHRRDLDTGAKDTGAKVFAALGQPVLMHGARPTRDQVQQPCREMILPSRQVHDASELTRAPSASVLVMPHASHQPPAPEPPQKRSYRTKRVGFVVTFRLFGAEKSVLKLVGANLKDGQNVLVLWRLFGLLVPENPH